MKRYIKLPDPYLFTSDLPVRIKDFLNRNPRGLKRKEIADGLKTPQITVNEVLDKMIEDHVVVKSGNSGGMLYRLASLG